MTSLAKELTK